MPQISNMGKGTTPATETTAAQSVKYKQKLFAPTGKKATDHIDQFCSLISSMASLVRSGLVITQAVQLMVENTDDSSPMKGPLVEAYNYMTAQGMTLSEAFYRTKFFPIEFISILRVGQNSGGLAETLYEYITYLRGVIRAKKNFASALKYPMFMFRVIIVAFFGMMLYIVPKLHNTITQLSGGDFEGAIKNLPGASQLLFDMYDWLTMFGVIPAAVLGVVLFLFFTVGGGKDLILAGIYKIPKVAEMTSRMDWAQWLIMASICLRSGMTVGEMLHVMKDAELPKELAKRGVFPQIVFNVTKNGLNLSNEFKRVGVKGDLPSIMRIAENNGTLGEVFEQRGKDIMTELPLEIENTKVTINQISTGLFAGVGLGFAGMVAMTVFTMSGAVR